MARVKTLVDVMNEFKVSAEGQTDYLRSLIDEIEDLNPESEDIDEEIDRLHDLLVEALDDLVHIIQN